MNSEEKLEIQKVMNELELKMSALDKKVDELLAIQNKVEQLNVKVEYLIATYNNMIAPNSNNQ